MPKVKSLCILAVCLLLSASIAHASNTLQGPDLRINNSLEINEHWRVGYYVLIGPVVQSPDNTSMSVRRVSYSSQTYVNGSEGYLSVDRQAGGALVPSDGTAEPVIFTTLITNQAVTKLRDEVLTYRNGRRHANFTSDPLPEELTVHVSIRPKNNLSWSQVESQEQVEVVEVPASYENNSPSHTFQGETFKNGIRFGYHAVVSDYYDQQGYYSLAVDYARSISFEGFQHIAFPPTYFHTFSYVVDNTENRFPSMILGTTGLSGSTNNMTDKVKIFAKRYLGLTKRESMTNRPLIENVSIILVPLLGLEWNQVNNSNHLIELETEAATEEQR